MNFLGGEVSPNAYKRLDMANNGKWFETAKNIYFGTTGDFHNRRGFIHIGKPYPDSVAGEKMKLIPFVYNRSQSYCIAFYNNDFSILKDGHFLEDSEGNRIYIQHAGFSLANTDDLSYCQIGDILYICSGYRNKIFTITRYSETDWRWDEFFYEIPPMLSVNQDKDKTLTFSTNQFVNSGYYSVSVGPNDGTYLGIVVDAMVNGTRTTIYTAPSSFSSLSAFVTSFNTAMSQTPGPIEKAVLDGDRIFFYLSSGTTFDNVTEIRMKLGAGSSSLTEWTFSDSVPGYTVHQGSGTITWGTFSYPTLSATDKIKKIKITSFQHDHIPAGGETVNAITGVFERDYEQAKTPYDMMVDYLNYIGWSSVTPYDVQYYGEFAAGSYVNFAYQFDVNRFEARCSVPWSPWGTYNQYGDWSGCYLNSIVLQNSVSEDTYFVATSNPVPTQNGYSVLASFPFFADKNIGDIFSVDSIYSPNRDGRAGENKSFYSSSISTGETTTDGFWSNGNWRIVTSGLFAGTIELQYSYDGVAWFTHKTFSSSIRTENSVSYGTNYNEFGTIDADDNILLRLYFNITAQTNLTVLLDAESFKNRSYYKIVEKDSTTPDTKATVYCILYSVGTPNISKVNQSAVIVTGGPVYEWAEAAWSVANGFPKVAFFYQNRLGLANTEKNPHTIWFSKTDNFKDFSTKIDYTDDDPITISALRSTGVSEVTTVASAKKLFVFTADHEDGIMDEGALTQANKQLVGFTYYGADPIETRNVSNKIIFIERGGHAARALTYDYAQENYEAVDLTIPYKHLLTNERIIASEYLPGDYKTYLMLTSIGRLICFKYLPEQRIEACSWFMHASGKITNICVVNNEQGYDLYVAIDSGNNKFIEYMNILPYTTGVYFDSYKQYSSEVGVSSITDASYFVPGVKYTVSTSTERYDVTADNSSTITLKSEVLSCAVGVKYVSEATLIEPNFNSQNGTTNYNRKNMYKAHFTFTDSEGFKVGVKNRDRSFKQMLHITPDNKEKAIYPREGERSFILQSSYLEPNMLSFVQEEPLPMHITNAEVEVDYGGK